MKYKYPHTEAMLGMSGKDLVAKKLAHVENMLEAAYWASGKWLDVGYDEWLESLHEEAPRSEA